jgi:type VI secretion system secreted protein VgrG
VTGPPGEEIYVDRYGRVKVQFFWDRRGKRDENSSCWIRVSEQSAGKGWGSMIPPRIGQEVIVDFLEGNPDRPLITGRVYNAEQMPPLRLPAEKAQSGLKSRSTPGGGGYNEMIMDDTKGKELIRVHGQYDMDTTVEHDLREHVLNNRSRDVAVDSSEQVGNNRVETVGNNMSLSVGKDLMISAGTSITLRCGASTIHMNQAGFITISGTVITVAAAANLAMTAPLTEVVGGVMLSAVGGVTLVEGGVTHIGGAKLVSVTSGGQVEVTASGDLIAKGAMIKLNG